MDHADGGWTVVNESKIDGSCNCPEGQDDEAMSQPDKIEIRISIRTNDKMLHKTTPYPVSSPGSERQVSALLTSKSPLAYQSGFLSWATRMMYPHLLLWRLIINTAPLTSIPKARDWRIMFPG
jgi:hypothetical protein